MSLGCPDDTMLTMNLRAGVFKCRRIARANKRWRKANPERMRDKARQTRETWQLTRTERVAQQSQGDPDVPIIADRAGLVGSRIVNLFSVSSAAESDVLATVLRDAWITRGGPVTRLADMPEWKQTEMRRMYRRNP